MPFSYLKTNKSPGADEIKFNVIKHCFGKLCDPLSLTVHNLRMGRLLDFNLSDVTKCWPVFLDDLQFKIFTLIVFQKAVGKTRNFGIFPKGRHFMLDNHRNVNLGVFREIYVGFPKSEVSLIFSKYCKNYINLNDKKAQI